MVNEHQNKKKKHNKVSKTYILRESIMKKFNLLSLVATTIFTIGALQAAPPLIIQKIVMTRANAAGQGSITMTVSGGTPIQTGTGTNGYKFTIDGVDVVPAQASPFTFTRPEGTHTIKVTDNAGVVVNAVVTIEANDPADVQITQIIIKNACDNLGSITVTVEGGVSPWSFSNDGGVTFTSSTTPTFTFSNLAGAADPGKTYALVVQSGSPGIATDADVPLVNARPQSTNAITNFITAVFCDGGCVFPPAIAA